MKRVSKKGENVMRKRYGWLVILVMGMVVCGATSFLKAHEETPCFTIQLWKNYETKDPIVKQKVTLQYEEEETLQTFTQLSDEDGKVVFPIHDAAMEKGMEVLVFIHHDEQEETMNRFSICLQKDKLDYVYHKEKNVLQLKDKQAPIITKAALSTYQFSKDPILISLTAIDDSNTSQELTYGEKGGPFQKEAVFTIVNNGRYVFYAKDEQGNLSAPYEVKVQNIDTTIPTLISGEKITLYDPHGDGRRPHTTLFQTCFAKEFAIRIPIMDEGSGIAKVTLFSDGLPIENDCLNFAQHPQKEDAVFVVRLPEEMVKAQGTISFSLEDAVGNCSDVIPITRENSNIKAARNDILLEKQAMQLHISADLTTAHQYANKDVIWLDQHVPITIQGTDTLSGIYEVRIYTKQHHLLKKQQWDDERKEEFHMKVSTSDIPLQYRKDGACFFYVEGSDHAGNISKTSYTCYVDDQRPTIAFFRLQGQTHKPVAKTQLELFYEEPLSVYVQALDGEASSGIAFIQWYTIDAMGVKSDIHKDVTDDHGGLSIPLDDGFSGWLYAMTQDYCHHSSKASNHQADVHSQGIVIRHQLNPHLSYQLPHTPYQDIEGLPLYTKSAPITIHLRMQDKDSGIQKVSWRLLGDEENTHQLLCDLQPKQAYQIDQKLKQDEQSFHITGVNHNLITSLETDIAVTSKGNHSTLEVVLMDWHNRTDTVHISFCKDTMAPNVNLLFEDQKEEGADNGYFTKRTAILQIQEQNFIEKGVDLNIQKDHKRIQMDLHWQKVSKDIYEARLSFQKDGTYALALQAYDAGKLASKKQHTIFTIDTKPPLVTIDRLDSGNTKGFFHQPQRITIQVDETHFDAARMKIHGVAKQQERLLQFPKPTPWKKGKDGYFTHLDFVVDGTYELQVQAEDKAGQKSESISILPFTIDTQKPQIEIMGVTANTAYQGMVKPVIICRDAAIDRHLVSVSLTCANQTKTKLAYQVKEQGKQLRYQFSSIPFQRTFDGIYTVSVKAKDRAGNQSEKTLTFSVNRFGSVYELPKVSNAYYRHPFAIEITESNVTRLLEQQVFLSVNGSVQKLKKEEYTVVKNKGNWYQYTYHLPKKLFQKNGRYQVYLLSKDAAGNANDNTAYTKHAIVKFMMDQNAPQIDFMNLNAHTRYDANKRKVQVFIRDNMQLKKVTILVNGKALAYEKKEDMYTFMLYQSSLPQQVNVYAEDAAGNIQTISCEDITILPHPSYTLQTPNGQPYGYVFVGIILVGSVAYIYKRRKHAR